MSNPNPLADGPEKNLFDKRYKSCGHGEPVCDENGHYDEVNCRYFNNRLEQCGDIVCPLDQQDAPDPDDFTDDEGDEDDDYHGEDKGYA